MRIKHQLVSQLIKDYYNFAHTENVGEDFAVKGSEFSI
jgi:hypothetical protein